MGIVGSKKVTAVGMAAATRVVRVVRIVMAVGIAMVVGSHRCSHQGHLHGWKVYRLELRERFERLFPRRHVCLSGQRPCRCRARRVTGAVMRTRASYAHAHAWMFGCSLFRS